MIFLLILLVWFATGFISFFFWWTREYKFLEAGVGLTILASYMGIFAWYCGYDIHSKGNYTFFGRKK